MLKNLIKIIGFCCFLFLITTAQDNEVEELKIGMPEFVCDKDGSIKDATSDMTTIRFFEHQGTATEKIDFNVNFERIGKKCANHQRCTLITWRRVRQLDEYLKHSAEGDIQAGILQINNSMLEPGIRYILNVRVTSGDKVQLKQLKLNYIDEEMKKAAEKPMASIELLAPGAAFAFNALVINAESSICSNISALNYKWQLYDNSNNLLIEFYEKGSELTIAADTFQAMKSYTVKCGLINLDEGKIIATQKEKIKIMSKGLMLHLSVKKITATVGQAVKIRALIQDLDNSGDENIKINWKCQDIDTPSNPCTYQSDSSELEMDSGFPSPGQYRVSLDVSKGEFAESASCLVLVTSETAPTIEVEVTEHPISPSSGATIRASVYQLRTHCTLQWSAPNDDENFESIDLDSFPGDAGKLLEITAKEDLFLQEIEEYSNGTFDRTHDLIIPPEFNNTPILQGDKKYMFRLTVQCPTQMHQDYEEPENDTEYVLNSQIVSTSEVVIFTNAAPTLKDFQVKPLKGVGYLTKFMFSAAQAEDKEGDAPFLYKFGCIIAGKVYNLMQLAGVTSFETVLPYAETPIESFVEVCDVFGSCGRTAGPTIETTLPPALESESSLDSTFENEIMQQFQNRLISEQYNRAFSMAVVIISQLSAQFPRAHDLISERINDEIDKFLQSSQKDENGTSEWKLSANNFIKNINLFIGEMQQDSETLSKLIELRNQIASNEKYTGTPGRKLLSIPADFESIDDIKGYIELSEILITSPTEKEERIQTEKDNLLMRMPSYLQKLCTVIHTKPQTINLEFKTVILAVEKLTKHSFDTFQSIPFLRISANNWQSTSGKIKLENLQNNMNLQQKCIAKAIFKDYFNQIGLVYYANIINSEDLANEQDVIIVLPLIGSNSGKPKCRVFESNWIDCKTIQVSRFIRCACKHLGFYRIVYDDKNLASEITTTKVPTDTLSSTTISAGRNDTAKNSNLVNDKTTNDDQYKTISIVVIVGSICGLLILGVILKHILQDNDTDMLDDDNEHVDFPKYALLYDEEIMQDAHI